MGIYHENKWKDIPRKRKVRILLVLSALIIESMVIGMFIEEQMQLNIIGTIEDETLKAVMDITNQEPLPKMEYTQHDLDLMNKYNTPELLQTAIQNGEVDINELSPDFRKFYESFIDLEPNFEVKSNARTGGIYVVPIP